MQPPSGAPTGPNAKRRKRHDVGADNSRLRRVRRRSLVWLATVLVAEARRGRPAGAPTMNLIAVFIAAAIVLPGWALGFYVLWNLPCREDAGPMPF